MTFVRCNRKHHCIAFARAGFSSLNHVAFEMHDLEAVMREPHKVGGPDDWKWPPGRIDHWGISTKDTARIAAAEPVYRWAST